MTSIWQILGAVFGGGVLSTVVQALFNYWIKHKEMNISVENTYLQNLEARMKEQDARSQRCEEERSDLYQKIASLENVIFNLKETISRIERKQLNASITCNDRGFIEEWSPGATALLYYTREEVVGRHLNILIPPKFREMHNKMYSQAVVEDRAPKAIGPRNLTMINRNGHEVPVIISLSGFKKDNSWKYVADIHLGDTNEEASCDVADERQQNVH